MVNVVDFQGTKVGEVSLDSTIFGTTPNTGLLHQALVRQLANARAGSANTKTRAEVAGGGRKPWRQKGTGRARAGSIRSPLWEGGGVIFGPKPRDFSQDMPKKMRRLAIAHALSAKKDMITLVKDFSGLAQGKTREMAAAFKSMGLAGKKILLVLDYKDNDAEKVGRAARNISGTKVIGAGELNVKDVIEADSIVFSSELIKSIGKIIWPAGETKGKKDKAAESAPAKEHTPQKETGAKGSSSQPKKKAPGRSASADAGTRGSTAKKPSRRKEQ